MRKPKFNRSSTTTVHPKKATSRAPVVTLPTSLPGKDSVEPLLSRVSYSKIRRRFAIGHLTQHIQDSYRRFCEEGIGEVFRRMFPIPQDEKSEVQLQFLDYELEKSSYTWDQCKERGLTFSHSLYVILRLLNRKTGAIIEQRMYVGEIPAITERGTFIINGAERVVVSQLIRSPGLYFKDVQDIRGRSFFSARIVPNRGTWLEMGFDINGNIFARIGKTRRIAVTTLLTARNFSLDTQVIRHAPVHFQVENTPQNLVGWCPPFTLYDFDSRTKDGTGEILVKSYEQVTQVEARRLSLIQLSLQIPEDKNRPRILTLSAHQPVFDYWLPVKELPFYDAIKTTYQKDPFKSREDALRAIYVTLRPNESNPTPEVAEEYLRTRLFNTKTYDLSEVGRYQINHKLQTKSIPPSERSLTDIDVIESLRRLIQIQEKGGTPDDIDHLSNRRVRCVGELALEALRTGLQKMERSVREKLQNQDTAILTPQMLMNNKVLMTPLRNFFNTGRLTQFLDQTNPLAELTHKRRLSSMGPGGLTRDRAGFEVRDVHQSHYGKICPIETPEGPNIGLITSLATYARINHHGFLETPYYKVENGRLTGVIEFLTADTEDQARIAEATTPVDAANRLIPEWVSARYEGSFIWLKREEIQYIDASPGQLMGISASLVPFLEHDDANRALMGSNMLRQAVPLLKPETPIVATGMESRCAIDSGFLLFAEDDGVVESVTGDSITLFYNRIKRRVTYPLMRFKRSNQGTLIDQRPIVRRGQKVRKHQILVDAQGITRGELALGRNLLVAFLPIEGYNFQDAVVVNERIVREDFFTSIHIEEYDTEARKTKMGREVITRDIPNVPEELLKALDEEGIIHTGAVVRSGDILVGKITPQPAAEKSPEESLLWKITGSRLQDYKHTSKKLPHGVQGWVIGNRVFKAPEDELPPDVEQLVRVQVAVKRKLQTGDKLAGRHGNKGVIAKIMPEEDMPFLPNGVPIDLIFSPLCIPSRMNLGQLFELHLGWAASVLKLYPEVPIFDGATEEEIRTLLTLADLPPDGKITLLDGKTGKPFEEPVAVGVMYIMKLYHLAADKIHARSTGTYTLVTQQPLGGKAQFGGQRFGEMEVWALEAYGASEILQEMLTIKSDDIEGRRKAYKNIVEGRDIPDHRMPESFHVLIKELKGLGIDVRFFKRQTRKEGLEEGER